MYYILIFDIIKLIVSVGKIQKIDEIYNYKQGRTLTSLKLRLTYVPDPYEWRGSRPTTLRTWWLDLPFSAIHCHWWEQNQVQGPLSPPKNHPIIPIVSLFRASIDKLRNCPQHFVYHITSWITQQALVSRVTYASKKVRFWNTPLYRIALD